jgi:hypothetical protein
MPGGRRVHIFGDRHDGSNRPFRKLRNGSGSTPRSSAGARRGCTLLSFQRPRCAPNGGTRRDDAPRRAEKRPLAGEAAPFPTWGSAKLFGSRTLLSRSASSATEEYSARQAESRSARRCLSRHGLASDPKALVAALSDLHDGAVEPVQRQVELVAADDLSPDPDSPLLDQPPCLAAAEAKLLREQGR